jgi:hypothetical protein
MATSVLPHPAASGPARVGNAHLSVIAALTAWLLLVVALGSVGEFATRPGIPPFPIAIGVAAPLLVFFACLRLSASFRRFVLTLDLRLIAGIQAWRWAGLGFLDLYAYGILPGAFALPAGLGDMAIGVTAPWIMLALARDPGFAASSAFVRWNLFGILDLVVALSIGTLLGILGPATPGAVSTAPMQTLPLLLIPVFLVPLFLMLHAAALMQSRVARSARAAGASS